MTQALPWVLGRGFDSGQVDLNNFTKKSIIDRNLAQLREARARRGIGNVGERKRGGKHEYVASVRFPIAGPLQVEREYDCPTADGFAPVHELAIHALVFGVIELEP